MSKRIGQILEAAKALKLIPSDTTIDPALFAEPPATPVFDAVVQIAAAGYVADSHEDLPDALTYLFNALSQLRSAEIAGRPACRADVRANCEAAVAPLTSTPTPTLDELAAAG